MREAQLRNVLLVKAIEETDGTQSLIPDSDREAATREAARNTGDVAGAEPGNDPRLSRRAQRMLVERAELLLSPRVASHPFIRNLSHIAAGSAATGWLLVALSVLLGGALSAVDGARRIDILSLPLLGLIAWNLLVYAAVVVGWIRSKRRKRPRRAILPSLLVTSVMRKVRRFTSGSASYSAPLAEALDRFVREWSETSKPLLLARATRLFHLCAAATGGGLIAALYLRSLTVDYSAGWESTFLDPIDVHAIISIVYAPAAALVGIAIPDALHLETIRWHNGGGGERAAFWIHLLAASVAVYIIAPRLVFAALSTLSIWRRSFDADLPADLAEYFTRTFGAGRTSTRRTAAVVPYGYEPADAAPDELRRQLTAALGEGATIQCFPAVRYGDEDALLRDDASIREADVLILLLNLAATPEQENHGAAIDRIQRSATGSTRALIVIDEGPYAARMLPQGGAVERMQERRRLWEGFVEQRGAAVCFVDLRGPESGTGPERLRAALLQV